MPRKNFGVRLGRPPATAASRMGPPPMSPLAGQRMPAPAGVAPSGGFAPGIPASGFNKGGKVHGFSRMPKWHDDPAFGCGGPVKGKK
jgi:hypothetical protein